MMHAARWKGLLRWALRLGGTLAFSWFVLRQIDIAQAAEALTAAAWPYVALAILVLYPLTLLLWARRWHLLLRLFGVRYAFLRLLRINLIGLFLGFVVADSVGGFIKLFYMRDEGVSVPRAFAATFMDKGFELLMLVAFGLSGVVVFPGVARMVGWEAFGWLAVGTVGLGLVWGFRRPVLVFLTRWLARLLRRRVMSSPDETPAQVAAILHDVSPSGWLHLLFLSLVIRLVHFSIAYLMALALRIPITYWQTIAVMSVVGIVLALPLSIGGLGTRDATLVVLFSLLGLPAEQAVVLALLLFLYQLPWRALGLVIWWRNPLGSRRALFPASSSL